MKKIFISATRQNDGKTMVSMGLFKAFQKRFGSVAYMKPVGQQYKVIDGQKIDKDAVLFHSVYGLKDPLIHMSPIAVPSGFTENYIMNPNRELLVNQITNAYTELTKDKEFLLIEGTGHAGVGSVFDMSNGDVAKLIGSKVVLVSLGGIGRSIDEIMLNKSCFDKVGVEIIGVIVNKVKKDKYDKVYPIVKKGLARHNIELLGMVPFETNLSKPTIVEIKEELGADLLSGANGLHNPVEKVVIGAMEPHDALDYLVQNTLLIVPGNREGLIMTALFGNMLQTKTNFSVSGIVFTAGIRPNQKILDLIRQTDIPLMIVNDDSFMVTTKINNMLVKLRSEEQDKIKTIHHLVEQYIDVDDLCSRL